VDRAQRGKILRAERGLSGGAARGGIGADGLERLETRRGREQQRDAVGVLDRDALGVRRDAPAARDHAHARLETQAVVLDLTAELERVVFRHELGELVDPFLCVAVEFGFFSGVFRDLRFDAVPVRTEVMMRSSTASRCGRVAPTLANT
jgi:hypothetical protein